MADIIHLLPDVVANQIAAGEVIQRPSSVIKELMENSVDAGATSINVWVTDAGKSCIRVADNGKGMSETDARLAFERHATSKISAASDLFALRTMGFRGEALASIVAVSQVELKTRTADDELGVWLSLNGPKIVEQKPVACNVGTNFAVKNIFFNVPARRRFLKSNSTELSNIMAEFERIALVYPDINFTFHRDDTLVFDLRPCSFRKRITSMFGTSLDKQLLPVAVDTAIVKIDGFVGTPESARTKGAKQFFFINNRFMRHSYFNRAIMTAFERLIASDRQVPYFLRLEVDPSKIDVNIHPTKTEIKFEDDQAIWQVILAAVKEALGRFNAIPTIDFSDAVTPEIPSFVNNVNATVPQVKVDQSYNPFHDNPRRESISRGSDSWEELYATLKQTTSTAVANDTNEEKNAALYDHLSSEEKKDWENEQTKYFQYKEHYILTSVKSGLMVIDQRRAHIRILYEKYMAQIEAGKIISQGLLFPELLQIPITQVTFFREKMKTFEDFGFDLSDLGSGSFAVNGIPSGADNQNSIALVQDIFNVLLESEHLTKEKIFYQVSLTLARKNAIKVGQTLSEDEIKKLVDDLFSCQTPNYTPDGKILLTILTDGKLEALFR